MENQNTPNPIIHFDPASADAVSVALMKDGKIEALNTVQGIDLSDLAKRVTDFWKYPKSAAGEVLMNEHTRGMATLFGISREFASGAASLRHDSAVYEMLPRVSRHLKRQMNVEQRYPHIHALIYAGSPQAVRSAASRRGRKRALQQRMRVVHASVPIIYQSTHVSARMTSGMPGPVQQIPKSPTGRLNVSGPNRPDSWRKPSALAETVRKLRDLWK